ncbi:MAG TPA: flavin reductase family protein [Solirubrobacteraceae bacterium]|nr:flavin reductase family protein [Solirubrobacteraceae bacterium]
MSVVSGPGNGVAEREGVARLTRVAKVARPGQSTGMMPPIRPPAAPAGSARQPPAPPRTAVEPPTGVAKLTPRSSAAEAAARELRQVMGRFATGVTVVTTAHRDTIHGMTANAFLSVSLRPPLVLVSLGRCRMSEMLPRTGRYGVSVLASDQEQYAAHFAGQRAAAVPPAFIWEKEFPLLDGALAHVGCRVVDVHTAGDHVLWIGEVEHLSHREGEPLLFYTGRFGTLREVSDRASGRPS